LENLREDLQGSIKEIMDHAWGNTKGKATLEIESSITGESV